MLLPPHFKVRFLGRDYVEYKMYTSTFLSDKLAAGITAGPKANSDRTTPNEDCLGIVEYEDGSLLYMIADGHKGAEAAEIAIEVFPTVFQHLRHWEPAETIDNILKKAAMETQGVILRRRTDRSRTTFLGVLQREQHLEYIQVGDSFLYTRDQNGFHHIPNRGMIQYLGEPELSSIDTGELTLTSGDTLLLASDGPHNFGMNCEYLDHFRKFDPKSLVDHILKTGATYTGGNPWDNIVVIALEE